MVITTRFIDAPCRDVSSSRWFTARSSMWFTTEDAGARIDFIFETGLIEGSSYAIRQRRWTSSRISDRCKTAYKRDPAAQTFVAVGHQR